MQERRKQNTITQPELEPRPLDLEFHALFTRADHTASATKSHRADISKCTKTNLSMSFNFRDKASSLLMRLSMVLLALGREQEMKSVQADVKLYSFANVTYTKERMEKSEIYQR